MNNQELQEHEKEALRSEAEHIGEPSFEEGQEASQAGEPMPNESTPNWQRQRASAPNIPYTPYNAAPARTQDNRPVRRVGTVTMGLSLITVGAASIYSLFNPNFDMLMVAKLAPAILIFIGIEILIGATFLRNERLKYDFLSGFVCFVLISASIGFTVSGPLLNYFGPQREMLEGRLADELYDACYSTLKKEPDISSMWVNVSLSRFEVNPNITIKDLYQSDYVHVNLELKGNYASKLEFAKRCKEILSKLEPLAASTAFRVSFNYDHDDSYYSLSIRDRFQWNGSAEDLARMIEGTWAEQESQSSEVPNTVEESSQAAVA